MLASGCCSLWATPATIARARWRQQSRLRCMATNAAARVKILDQLEVVSRKLAADELSGRERMKLLRRQAELGDQRDVLAEAARRSTAAAS